jgi:hypothetical protein
MRTIPPLLAALLLGGLASSPAASQEAAELEGDHLYHVVMLRAAPGRLPELIELLKEERDLLGDVNEPLPLWMRHSQGDQWDLLLLYSMGDFHSYFEPARTTRRLASGERKGLSQERLRMEADLLTSLREELFVKGPDPRLLGRAFADNGYYHVEMMVALAGKHRELLDERRMENVYRRELGRPVNFIFVREAGGPWDTFTIGFYKDIRHFAETSSFPAQEQERAARAAGFESAEHIGVYMRRLILYHRDTLATAIR